MMILWAFVIASLVSAKCFEPTVAHPPPEYHRHEPLLQQAFKSIRTILTEAVVAPEFASASFSVEITSSKESLWSQHHTALERNASRPDIPEVNGDALYRIASITKSFTVLAILYQHKVGNLNLDDTVDEYIQELGHLSDGGIPWKDITLRSLASQLSGIPRDCKLDDGVLDIFHCYTLKVAQSDVINVDKNPFDIPSDMGLPLLSRKGLIKCDEYSPNYETPCTFTDLLKAIKSKRPVFAPNQKSTYSNIAYELLGVVIERVTNQSYESYINEAIIKPLNMSKSTLSRPPDSAGVIPLEPHYWGIDEGIQNPTGGIYASTGDLSKYLRYILQHFNAITHAINWINPVSPSRGLHSFYGMPWEIFQTDRILKDSKRTVRFVTKSGGLPGYTSIIMTVPEYDLGITILVAGNPRIFSKIQDVVTIAIVRAAEQLSIRQLKERYAGTYASKNSSLNSSISIVADARGLVIEKWISNSTNVLESKSIQAIAPKKWYAQLVPTLLYRDFEQQSGEEWRILVTEERSESEGEIWDDFCITDIDSPTYAQLPINEAIFWDEDKAGAFETIELAGFRVNLTRVEDEQVASPYDDQEVMEL